MAQTLSLVLREEFMVDSEVLPLTGYTAGVEVASWSPTILDEEDVLGDEVITLRMIAATQDALATRWQDLITKMIQAKRFVTDDVMSLSVWLRDQRSLETLGRQALVAKMTFDISSPVMGPPFDTKSAMPVVTMAYTRGHWEAQSHTVYNTAGLSAIGGMQALGAVTGDYPARLGYVTIDGYVGAGLLTKFWVGFRSSRYTDHPENFKPVWEAELASMLQPDTAVTSLDDATASGTGTGRAVRCTFATTTALTNRFAIVCSSVSPTNYNDQRGHFHVLARVKCGSANVRANLLLSSGFWGSSAQNPCSFPIAISGTAWQIIDLGEVTFPETGRSMAGDPNLKNQTLWLAIERTAGSGVGDYVEVDCLMLIPTGEGFIYSSGGYSSTLNRISIQQQADGQVFSRGFSVGYATHHDLITDVDGGLPTGPAVYVIYAATHETAGSTLTDASNIAFQVWKRWAFMRGNES